MLFVSCGLCLVAYVLSKSQSRVGLSQIKSTVKVIVLRTPSDRVASAVRLDCVRRPLRLRSVSDWIAFGVGGGKWRLTEPVVGILVALSWVFVLSKLI